MDACLVTTSIDYSDLILVGILREEIFFSFWGKEGEREGGGRGWVVFVVGKHEILNLEP